MQLVAKQIICIEWVKKRSWSRQKVATKEGFLGTKKRLIFLFLSCWSSNIFAKKIESISGVDIGLKKNDDNLFLDERHNQTQKQKFIPT